MGAVIVARRRTARVLGIPGSRSPRLAEYLRHQKSGGGRDGRTGRLRKRSRDPDRRFKSARSRAVVELLCRAALHFEHVALCALGSIQPRRTAAEIRDFRFSRTVVVRCRQGGPDRQTILKEFSRMAQLTRRNVLRLGVGAIGAGWVRAAAAADDSTGTHGLSVFGDLKYPPDFHHFDYVNPAAPKGGVFSTIPSVRTNNQSYQTFNSLNAFILKGEGAQGMDLTFTVLMARAGDEPDALYGLAAKSVQISDDKLIYRFTLRPEARFHDGSGITARDVAFSINTLKAKGHPLVQVRMRDVKGPEALDDAT